MASKAIKGITIQIGGDTTGLDKALNKVDAEARSIQGELKEINKALKFDPKNTQLLEQKQRALASAVETSKKRLEALKKAQDEATGKLSQAQYDALQREIVETEADLKKAEAAADQFRRQTSKLGTAMGDLSTSAGQVATATQGVSIAGAAVVGSIATAAVKTAEWADNLLELSNEMGISTDALQKMQYASELVDVSVESMTGALARMTRQLASASGEEKIRALGVATREANGELRSGEAIFYDVLTALSHVGNETERDALAMNIFGKSANELAGIIDDGGAKLRALGEEAERNGSIIEGSLVEQMGAFQDKIDAFKASALPELLKAGGSAIEALTPLLESLVTVLTSFLKVIGSIDPTLLQVVATLGIFAASISPIASGVAAVGNAILALVSGQGMAKLVEMMGTVGGKATAIVALLGLLVMLISQIANAWGDMSGWEKAISVMGALVVAATAAAIALGAVQSAATMGIAAAAIVAGVVAITAAVNSANKRAASSQQLNQRGGLPMMANGGVLMSGSAIVGEAGPELLTQAGGRSIVQPLTNNYTTTNYNTSSQPLQVNIQLDRETMARALVTPMGHQMALAGGSTVK